VRCARLARHLVWGAGAFSIGMLVASCAGPRVAPARTDAPAIDLGDVPFVISREAWSFAGKEGVVLITPTHRIHTTIMRGSLADRLPVFLSAASAAHRTLLGELPPPRQALEVYVLADRDQWASLSRSMLGSRANTYLQIDRGGFSIDGKALLFDIGTYDTLSIAAHEGWHQYVQTTFRDPLPSWLDEGVGTWFEGFRWRGARGQSPDDGSRPDFRPWANPERYGRIVHSQRRDRLMSLEEVTNSRPQDLIPEGGDAVLTWYAQSWALIHFLREGEGGRYRDGLERALKAAADGTLYDEVRRVRGSREASLAERHRRGTAILQTFIDEDVARLSDEYAAWLAQIASARRYDLIMSGRSPIETPE
jgi:hypothetical protein